MTLCENMDWTGIVNFSAEDFTNLMTIDREPRKKELPSHQERYAKLYDRRLKKILFKKTFAWFFMALSRKLSAGTKHVL